uniref:Protein kinase domain-containing protein n=1 Tax=Macrostomum lignano TaxID=282301 RepID=A0A1I8JDJ0_9PLAT
MELLDGKTLEAFIDKTALDENKIRDFSKQERPRLCLKSLWMLQVSYGFQYLQEGQNQEKIILHRDLSADNVLIDFHLNAKIADFGLAKSLPHSVMTADTWEFEKKRGLERLLPELYADTCKQPDKYGDRYLYGILIVEVLAEFSVRECFSDEGAKDDYKRMVLEGKHFDSFQGRIIGCNPEPSQERDKAIEIMRMTAQVNPENRATFTQVSQVWNQCDVRAMQQQRQQTLDYLQKTDDTEQQLTQLKISNDPLTAQHMPDAVSDAIGDQSNQWEVVSFLIDTIAKKTGGAQSTAVANPAQNESKDELEVVKILLEKIPDQTVKDQCCKKSSEVCGKKSVISKLLCCLCRKSLTKLRKTTAVLEQQKLLPAKFDGKMLNFWYKKFQTKILPSSSAWRQWNLLKSLKKLHVIKKVLKCIQSPESKLLFRRRCAVMACSRLHQENIVAFLGLEPDWLLESGPILSFLASLATEGMNSFLTDTLSPVQSRMQPAQITQMLRLCISERHITLSVRLTNDETFSREHVDLPDNTGATALMLAADGNYHELIEKLLDLGASVNSVDSQSRTALSRACEAGHLTAAKIFVTQRSRSESSRRSRSDLYAASGATSKFRVGAAAGPLDRRRWDAVRLIGRGGFGEVYEVLTDTGVRCAAKTLKLTVQLGDELPSVRTEIHRAIESERNLCRLLHPNIVRFLYIAQPEPATICRALLYLHSRQPPVIHRDINCSNIIVCADNSRIKLIDFGLSIKLEHPKGTLNFMAPELLGAGESDSMQYSRESDIWAFGCSVFQMVSGARPFRDAQNIFQVAWSLANNGAPALPDGRSAQLRDFYSRCTTKDRKERNLAQELLQHEFLTGG